MRSVYDNVEIRKAIFDPAVAGTSGTPVSKGVFTVDTFGFNTGMFEIFVGTPTGTTVTYSVSAQVYESATSGGTFAAVAGSTGTATGFGTALAAHCQVRVEGLGTSRLRYLQLYVVVTTSPTDKVLPVSAVAILGRAFKNPVSNVATIAASATT